MVKRLFDFTLSLLAIVLLLPIFLFAALGIKLSSEGTIFYKSKRAGKNGVPFTMYKFRSMDMSTEYKSAITGANDSRVFPFGGFLRKSKLDELPQLINVLKGQMTIVGPRPENIRIVENHYTLQQYATLNVLPGLTSPGSLFDYTHGDYYLGDEDPQEAYVDTLLPLKLSLELFYVENQSLFYDLEIVLRTIVTILQIIFGKKSFDYPKEYYKVKSREGEDI